MTKDFDQMKYEKIAELAAELDKIGSNISDDELTYEEESALEARREAMQFSQDTYHLAAQADRKIQRKAIRNDPVLMATLKKRGLSVEEFMELQNRNPHAYQQAYPQGIENYLDLLTGKKADRESSFFRNDPAKPHPQAVQRLRERAKKAKGSDEDIDDQLKILGF